VLGEQQAQPNIDEIAHNVRFTKQRIIHGLVGAVGRKEQRHSIQEVEIARQQIAINLKQRM
jgi:hypothetical protein